MSNIGTLPAYNDDMKKLAPTAQQFRMARLAAGLSQSKASKVLDVPLGSIKNWEQGRRPVEWMAFELLLLKTGQFELKKWKPPAAAASSGELRIKLAFAGTLTLHMTTAAFHDFAAAVAREVGR